MCKGALAPSGQVSSRESIPFLGGVHRFATNLKEVEEVRQEVREVNDEESGEINVDGEQHTS